MADDAATVEQLQAELRQLRERDAGAQTEIASLCAEAERRDRALAESLDQQTVTAEILRIIATSPGDIHPILDAVVESARRLSNSPRSLLGIREGDALRVVAAAGAIRRGNRVGDIVSLVPETASVSARAMREQRTIHVPDMSAPAFLREFPDHSMRHGSVARVHVPLIHEQTVIGILTVTRDVAHAYSPREIALVETFARQAAITIANARLVETLGRRNAELAESLEQQTATGEILRVIATSPTDLQSVLDALAENAARLCGATGADVLRLDDHGLRLVAAFGTMPTPIGESRPVGSGTVPGRAVLERRTIHVPDLAAVVETEYPDAAPILKRHGHRARLVTPLLRQGAPIGAIGIARREPGPFSDRQISLLETFADQAVIAIENARLFSELETSNRELTEALEQQTVTAEVLRVIASSPADLRPVLNAIASAAAKLTESDGANVQQLVGQHLRSVGRYGATDQAVRTLEDAVDHGELEWPAISPESISGRAFLERQTIHVTDVAAAVETDFPQSRPSHLLAGQRVQVSTPLLREGEAVGVLGVQRFALRPYTDRQIELLKTFADQAVIAIENARLFEELERRNRELSEALEREQATGEILRVLATSPADLQAVLETVVKNAARLCGANGANIWRVDGHRLRLATNTQYDGLSTEWSAQTEGGMPLNRASVAGRSIIDRRTVHVHDLAAESDDEYPEGKAQSRRFGHRTTLATPLLANGEPLGAILTRRHDVRPFTDDQIALLETFADQASIAIANSQLFERLQEANRQLEEASQHKSQFLANMSHELRTPLNAIIGYSEMLQEEADDLDADAFLPDLQRINAAGKHLLGLINDILDLSKIEAGRMDLYLETFSVAELIRDVVSIVQPLVEKNANTLVVSCADDLGTMQADQTKVRQALFNLMSNASKDSPGNNCSSEWGRRSGGL